ncbi:YmiA family putative membrane protein [Serratia quinivorans]|nr:YmiA family putative membrane protein [Serratia quinivorans]
MNFGVGDDVRDVKRRAWLAVFAISGLFWLLVGLSLWWLV